VAGSREKMSRRIDSNGKWNDCFCVEEERELVGEGEGALKVGKRRESKMNSDSGGVGGDSAELELRHGIFVLCVAFPLFRGSFVVKGERVARCGRRVGAGVDTSTRVPTAPTP